MSPVSLDTHLGEIHAFLLIILYEKPFRVYMYMGNESVGL